MNVVLTIIEGSLLNVISTCFPIIIVSYLFNWIVSINTVDNNVSILLLIDYLLHASNGVKDRGP